MTKKARLIFCVLNDFVLDDNYFVPKGAIVQLIDRGVVENNESPLIVIKVSDYVKSNARKDVSESRHNAHATSSEPIFLKVSPAILKWDNSTLIHMEQ